MNRGDLEIENKKYEKLIGYSITERELLDLILKIDPQLEKAYKIKEAYRRFNDSQKEHFNGRQNKKEELQNIITSMLNSNIKEYIECARTLNTWQNEILNSFTWVGDRRLSNGPIEGKNTYIKKIISNANGYQNFERAKNKFIYSQNLYDTYSLLEHEHIVKRKRYKRGHYKKKN